MCGHARDRAPAAIGTDIEAGPSGFDYSRAFRLHDNPTVHYIAQNDDICDLHVAPIRLATPPGPSDDTEPGSLEGSSLAELASGSTGGRPDSASLGDVGRSLPSPVPGSLGLVAGSPPPRALESVGSGSGSASSGGNDDDADTVSTVGSLGRRSGSVSDDAGSPATGPSAAQDRAVATPGVWPCRRNVCSPDPPSSNRPSR